MENALYVYRAIVSYIYDGDTITCNIDLGLNIWVFNEKIRLARINTPELHGNERADGLAARDFLRQLLDGKSVLIQTSKDKKGKYGRYIADVFLPEVTGNFINVNDLLVEKGFAVYQDY